MKVNEIFGPTIQGEGKTAGMPCLFLRLATCNLHCVWCDTPYTWNWTGTPFAHPDKFDPAKEIHEMTPEQILVKLEELSAGSVWSLIISGGEPMLQWKQLTPLLQRLKMRGWWVEIETNGTVAPTSEFSELVDQFNCSPKLSNSGDQRKLRIRPEALVKLAQNPKVYFKFVVVNEKDISEINEYVETYNMVKDRVYLMPLGKTREELEKTRGFTEHIAWMGGFKFSDRLHVIQFGGVRAV